MTEKRTADIIDLRGLCDVKAAVSEADQIARAINSTRAMLGAFEPTRRFDIISQVLAAEACGYAGRNACHGNAVKAAGECFGLTIAAINTTFPPPGEAPFA